MAAINDLIAQIQDPILRAKIEQEANKLSKQKKFGLVFEEHLPESTRLYGVPIRKGSMVTLKNDKSGQTYVVLRKTGDTAVCLPRDGGETVMHPLSDLVMVAEFGEPIYPYLEPLDSICNAPDSDLWHTLIEADNYHALQLLEYLYAGKVDCIYIDPPYNTGAKDWKYNNDYVDGVDTYRHSKWLSFMQKRLKIAKKLLNPKDSVLIVTIDEKEYLHLGCLLEEMFPEARMQMVTDEWQMKCNHWYQYSYEQHYAQVNPVFVIQVSPGTGNAISNTNLDDVIAKIEERIGYKFKEHEVVHTFGSTGTLSINGLTVHHIEPPEIADDKRVRIVLFKENLSTGWDCPRAETMMSFRHANDATYIAQLLGRMVRTPLQCHILVDDYLNDVRLFLPYFNQNTVKEVVEELQKTEGGDIPTVIDGESLENPTYVPWTVHPTRQKIKTPLEGQTDFFTQLSQAEVQAQQPGSGNTTQAETPIPVQPVHPQQIPTPLHQPKPVPQQDTPQENYQQAEFPTVNIDRAGITKFINEQGYLTYLVRSVRIHGYLKSLLSLASLLTQANIYPKASDEVANEVVDMIRSYVEKLMKIGEYDALAAKVLSFKLSVRIFDVFGEAIDNGVIRDMFTATDSDLDRQLRAADATLGGYGFPNLYGKKYFDEDDPSAFKIDCILFAADEECMKQLYRYAEDKFHDLDDQYRKYVVMKSDKCKKMYSDIIANGDVVSKHNFSLPETISVKVEVDGKKYDNHLFADEEGIATIKLNGWEEAVIEEEGKRKDFVCWLRNPSRGTWALCLPYDMHGETKAMYPDFIVVRYDPILNYVIDILEPHSFDFADNLGKAKGLARYAEAEPRIGRVQLIHPSKDPAGKTRLKRLDLSKGSVRNKVLQATSNDDLAKIFDTEGFFE